MNSDLVIQETVASFLTGDNLQSPATVVSALLMAEKTAKKKRTSDKFEQLIGTWRLCFVTGTQKARKRAGIMLGAGKYLPKFIKITITYKADDSNNNQGKVINCVDLKLLQLSVTGLCKFLVPQNILAFDFTRMQLTFFGLTFYNGYIRSGAEKEATFFTDSIKKQAFFTYFYLTPNAIAARGRGGGLALWVRI